jgi:hypothetical protein
MAPGPERAMALNQANDALNDAVEEHKKRKGRNAKSTIRIRVFLCAFCAYFALLVFPRLQFRPLIFSAP